MKGTSCKHGSQPIRPFTWLLRCQGLPVTLRHKFVSAYSSSFSASLLSKRTGAVSHFTCLFPTEVSVSPAWPVRETRAPAKVTESENQQIQVIRTRPPPTFYSNNQQSILFSSETGREKEDGVGHHQGLSLMPFGDHVPENGADAAGEEEWAPLTVTHWVQPLTSEAALWAFLLCELPNPLFHWHYLELPDATSDVSWSKVKRSKEIVILVDMEAWSTDLDKAVPQTYVFWDGRGHTAFITFSKYLSRGKLTNLSHLTKRKHVPWNQGSQGSLVNVYVINAYHIVRV